MVRQRLSRNDQIRLNEVITEKTRRNEEALQLYRPQPSQEPFHRSQAQQRVVRGGNRSGKTTAAVAEVCSACTKTQLRDSHGKPLPFTDAVVGGRSVGVPGAVRMLELAHREHGKLPWSQLFQPAIALAEGGFKVSARLNALLANEKFLSRDPVAAAYFYDTAGQPWPVGYVLKNPELAAVLRALAERADGKGSGGGIRVSTV